MFIQNEDNTYAQSNICYTRCPGELDMGDYQIENRYQFRTVDLN